jgi:hypothetical protein
MVRCIIFHTVPRIRQSLCLENTQGSLQAGMPGSKSETHGRFCDHLDTNIVVEYSVGPIISLHGLITAREYVNTLGNQVDPMIETLFPYNDAHSWNYSFSHGLKSVKVNFSTFTGQHNNQI